MADIFGIIGGAAAQAGLGALNNIFGAESAAEARRQNFKYNEWAAQNADARTRRLYNDIYSPSAQLRQLEAAGMSPSVFYQGSGSVGTSGAQGQGTAGQATPYMPISMLEGAEMAKISAETKNIEADTANKEEQNGILRADKMIRNNEASMKQWESWGYQEQYKIISSPIYKREEDGSMTFTDETLYGLAEKAKSYDDFIKDFDQKYRFSNDIDIHSEIVQKTLREIYKISHSMQTELEILTVNKNILNKEEDIKEEDLKLLKWQNQLAEAMKNAGFAEMNAQSQIKFLEAQIQQADLTERQKKAWNRLIDRMGDSTMSDIAVIVLSIISNMSLSASAGVNKSYK